MLVTMSLVFTVNFSYSAPKSSGNATHGGKTANIPPAVSITSPASGASYMAPATISISATASDTDGTISKVDFYQGSTLIGSDTAAPYNVSWNSVAAGSYTLTAKATDNKGAVTTSASVNITVTVNTTPNVAPSVSITAPASGATFTAPATVTVSASATDSDGTVSKVEFYQGTTLIGSDTTAPYSISWSSVAAGSYTLTAKATDDRGAVTTSSGVSISVAAAPVNAAPTVSLTAPANGQTFNSGSSITISATASDSDGTIAKVDFYNGTTLLNSDTTAPYSYTWSGMADGSYSIKAMAYDDRGAVASSAIAKITVGSGSASTGGTSTGSTSSSVPWVAKRTFYVSSSTGSDSNNGTSTSTPWKTLNKVNSFISSSSHAPGDWILFKCGDTFTGTINTTKSGTSTDRVVFGSYGTGAKPVITAGKTLGTWTQSSTPGVYYCTGVTNEPHIMTVDGALKGKGRFPKSSYLIYNVPSGSTGTTIVDASGTIADNWVGAEIVIRNGGQTAPRFTVKGQSGATITLSGTLDSPNNGAGYFFRNHMRTLTGLGDWMYNATEDRIYMYFGSNGPAGHEVKIDTNACMIGANGPSYLVFKDLALQYGGLGIYLKSGAYNLVQNCDFTFLHNGSSADGTAHNNTFRHNLIKNITNTGMRVAISAALNYTIEYNTFQNIGQILDMGDSGTTSGIGIYILGNGHTIRGNRFLNVGFMPIYFRHNNILVENNFFDGFGNVKDDTGAIYCWSPTNEIKTATSRMVRGNIILNGSTASGIANNPTTRVNGLYSDKTANVSYESNVVINVPGHAWHDCLSSNVFVRGNIFYKYGRYGINFQEGSDHPIRHCTVTGNVFLGGDKNVIWYNKASNDTGPVSAFTSASGNYYRTSVLKPFNCENTMNSLSYMQSTLGMEPGSTWETSQATDSTNLLVEYNDTQTDLAIDLGADSYKNLMTKAIVTGTITLKPGQSMALLKQ